MAFCTTQKALEHDKIAKKRGQNIGSSGREAEAFTKKYTRKSNFGIFDIYLVMLLKIENLNFPPFFSVNKVSQKAENNFQNAIFQLASLWEL